jgi:hypothetical protein
VRRIFCLAAMHAHNMQRVRVSELCSAQRSRLCLAPPPRAPRHRTPSLPAPRSLRRRGAPTRRPAPSAHASALRRRLARLCTARALSLRLFPCASDPSSSRLASPVLRPPWTTAGHGCCLARAHEFWRSTWRASRAARPRSTTLRGGCWRARDRGSRPRGLRGALAANSPPYARPAATSGSRASRTTTIQRRAPRTTATSGAPLSSPTRFSMASPSSRFASASSASPCTGVCACAAPSPQSRQISSSAGESALHCPGRAPSQSERRRHQYMRSPSRSRRLRSAPLHQLSR